MFKTGSFQTLRNLRKILYRILVVVITGSLILGQALPVAAAPARNVSAQDGITSTPTPTDLPTDVPTATAIPTDVPTATATEAPAVTPTATATEAPTVTPTATSAEVIPTSTEVPVTATNTPISTATATTATPSPTPTLPPAPQYTLTLSSYPGFMTQSRVANLEWTITGMTTGQTGLTLTIQLPVGYEPRNKKTGESFDPATHMYKIPVTSTQGLAQIRAVEALKDVTFAASLTQGTETLAADTMILPMHEQFDINPKGGSATAMNGKVKVTFPEGAVGENVVLDAGFPTDDALPQNGFSPKVFELKAHSKKNEEVEISHFDTPLTIEVYYGDLTLTEEQENNLYLYWYNQETGDWNGMETFRDKSTKTLRATTNHFTVFDVSVNNWQAARLPSVESFQVSQFTGAGTYSMPIEVPEGPGGFKPSITLSYNSQVVDQATTDTQASWVGMGWSLDGGGSIQSSKGNGYSLEVNGISTRLRRVSTLNGDYFRAADENFWKITYTKAITSDQIISWTVYDTQGNKYVFGKIAVSPGVDGSVEPYAWYLTQAIKTGGSGADTNHQQVISYSYAPQDKTVGGVVVQPAMYLDTIKYSNGKYCIHFGRGTRGDYKASDHTDALFHLYQLSSLDYIDITDCNNTTIRRYDFKYADNANANRIWPNISYSGGGKGALTLISVQENDGTTDGFTLPAQTFVYGDYLHLTSASNGYGGSVQFGYKQWHTDDDLPTKFDSNYNPDYDMTDDYVRTFNGGTGGEDSSPEAGWYSPSGILLGSDHLRLLFTNGTAANPVYFSRFYNLRNITRPGAVYQIEIHGGLQNGTGSFYAGILTGPGSATQLGTVNETNPELTLPTTASTAQLYLQVNNDTMGLYSATVKLRPTYYLVSVKTVSDGNGHSYTSNYGYPNSKVRQTDYQFLGNGTVTETAPNGIMTKTTFYQDDIRKGRVQDMRVYQSDTTTMKSWTTNIYKYVNYIQCYDPAVKCAWVYLDAQVNRTYDSTGTSFTATCTEYDYDEENHINSDGVVTTPTYEPLAGNYGNLLYKFEYDNEQNCGTHDHAASDYYRKTVMQYALNDTDSVYIVSLPQRERMYNAANDLLGDTLYFYDYATSLATAPGKNLLTRKQVKVNGKYAQTDYVYDNYGNQIEVDVCAADVEANKDCTGSTQVTTNIYDGIYHTYLTKTTNPLGQPTTFDYDYSLGVPISMTDANGATTKATYDIFGRMTGIIRPGDTSTSPTLEMSYNDKLINTGSSLPDTRTINPFVTTIDQKVDATPTFEITRKYDGLGREKENITGGVSTSRDYPVPAIPADKGPDVGVTITTKTMPGDSTQFVETRMDANTNTTTVTAPDGTTTIAISNIATATIQDAAGNSVLTSKSTTEDANHYITTTYKDTWGRVIKVVPPTGPAVIYAYNALDQLEKVSRGGALTEMDYDLAGHKLTMDDPDMGSWSYTYDVLGNLIGQTDARSCAITLKYDTLNRLIKKIYSTSCPTTAVVNYNYDAGTNGIGRRTSVSSGNTSSTWTYDARGRMISEAQVIEGTPFVSVPYTTSYTYNAADLPVTTTYPDNEVVTTTYDARMLTDTLTGEDSYVKDTQYDAAGRLTARQLGNTLTQNYNYYAWDEKAVMNGILTGQGGRLKTLTTGTLQNLTYIYDAVGNIKNINSVTYPTSTPVTETQYYGYDTLNRLTKWYVNNVQQEEYQYDPATGNLDSKTNLIDNTANISLDYDTAHPHAVTRINNAQKYWYDPNGNQTTRIIGSDTFTLSYDAENRLVSVKKNTTTTVATFIYDGDGKRVASKINGKRIHFVGNYYETDPDAPNTNYPVSNAGFESGTANWTSVTTSPATWFLRSTANEGAPHSGSYGYGISNNMNGRLTSAKIDVDASTQYTVSAWLRGVIDDAQGVGSWTFRAQYYDSAGTLLSTTNLIDSGTEATTPATWTQSTATFSTPANADKMEVYLQAAQVSGWIAIDDVSVKKGTTAVSITDPGFESGTGWVTDQIAPSPATKFYRGSTGNAAPHGGTYSYVITNAAIGNLLSDNISATAGTTYTISGYARGELDTSGGGFMLRVNAYKADATLIEAKDLAASYQGDVLTNTYQQFSGDYLAPANTAYLRVQLYNYRANGWVEFDDLKVAVKNGSGTNLLLNSGFESDTNWTASSGTGTHFWRAPGRGRNASYSYMISNLNYGSLDSDAISVDGDKNYQVSLSLRGELVDALGLSGWLIRVKEYDTSGTYLGYKDLARGGETSLNTNWQQVKKPYSAGANVASIKIQLYNYLSSGWVAFDDISIESISTTKYYYSGGQRVAMRKGGTLSYLLTDHLGSTSIATDEAGVKTSEMRYTPWGEARAWGNPPSIGSLPTDYTFTGQKSYQDDFGLMFYNARWYDSYLNHFTQPDTIVPDPYNSQDYDRYSYVRNNPLKYTDPTGHTAECIMSGPGGCLWYAGLNTMAGFDGNNNDANLRRYGITTSGISEGEKWSAGQAAMYAATKLYNTFAVKAGFASSVEAFKRVVGNFSIQTRNANRCETVGSVISCGSDARYMTAFLHEIGHVMDNHFGQQLSGSLKSYDDFAGDPIDGGYGNTWVRTTKGFMCYPNEGCLEHPPSLGYADADCNVGDPQMSNCARQEQFADTFMNWVLDGTGDSNHGFTGDQGYGRAWNFQCSLVPGVLGINMDCPRP